MVNKPICIRLEAPLIKKLQELAKSQKTTYTELIRAKIKELCYNEVSPEAQARARRLIRDLSQKFVYVRNIKGRSFSTKERATRTEFINKLKEAFNLK